MSNILQIVENEQTSEFYPTPESLVKEMLAGVNWDFIHTILEPSAGKGDILRVLAEKENLHRCVKFDVDCIEIDPNLRAILKYNFSAERKREILSRENEIEKSRVYNRELHKYEELTPTLAREYRTLKAERLTFFENGIHIVHDDFLTYSPYKQYDLIVMNPPFSNGDKHLLKALKIQEKGGSIICLLNAETIKNPYTDTRRELINLLNKHNATITYINDAFVSAERRTGVEVALIKVSIEKVQEESDIYNRLKEAAEIEDFAPEATELDVTDFIKAAINQFNVEIKAGLELIRQYRALKPYMLRSFDTVEKRNADGTVTREYESKAPILRLTVEYNRSYDDVSTNEYVKLVRLKYWRALLSNKQFVGKLTSKLQSEYQSMVDKLKEYDFTEFNIRTLHNEINSKIKSGIEDEIIKMFDRLTEEHSYYPECSKNRHLYDGWKTNKAHKIDKKVIIPCYGVFDSWDGRPRTYNVKGVLEDIERIFNFFDGGMSREVDFWGTLESCFNRGITKNIELKYFSATFYKKGTVHLVFNCPELIERFNIYAAQYKKWLPPNYGKTKYKDMTAEEKAVVDSFQGEKAYNNILENSNYYLAPVVNNQVLMLEG